MDADVVGQAVSDLDAWLETMRQTGGYGGPVSHWWRNCLHFAGPGLDWRYEGIIGGYLELHRKTGSAWWLERAARAGDDLVAGQLQDGTFARSSFELNPYAGGTPHEAASDLALLWLARALRNRGNSRWTFYLIAAARSLTQYVRRHFWDAQRNTWRDDPETPSFVPNKAATLAEALICFDRLTAGSEGWSEPAIDAALQDVIGHQMTGGALDGAIYQNSFGGRPVPKLFPYYVARCASGLFTGYEWSGRPAYLDAALRAVRFILRYRYPDGSFPQVVYENGAVNRYPQWIAATGDVLRVLDRAAEHGLDADPAPTERWLLAGRTPSGAFQTAYGFAAQTRQRMRPGEIPELRDRLPVVGWNDKAFRFLASRLPEGHPLPPPHTRPFRAGCAVGAHTGIWSEDASALRLERSGRVLFAWTKGEPWVSTVSPRVLTA